MPERKPQIFLITMLGLNFNQNTYDNSLSGSSGRRLQLHACRLAYRSKGRLQDLGFKWFDHMNLKPFKNCDTNDEASKPAGLTVSGS